jgi:hypothetical protein
MSAVDRIHRHPRGVAINAAPSDELVPALAKLSRCQNDFATLILIDSLPSRILPNLAWHASQKRYVPPVAVKTLIKACGPAYLERCLGPERARLLRERFPTSAPFAKL